MAAVWLANHKDIGVARPSPIREGRATPECDTSGGSRGGGGGGHRGHVPPPLPDDSLHIHECVLRTACDYNRTKQCRG